MLATIGAKSVEEIIADQIPEKNRFTRPLNVPPAMGELELTQHAAKLASLNQHVAASTCFLGGGAYDHFVPAAIDALASRGEFYTSYTPYQPEVSQGNLQATFEYQSMVCELTGLDVSNASLYDGASATVEAALLAMSVTKRLKKVVVLDSLHPQYRDSLETYLNCLGSELVTVPCPAGRADLETVAKAIDGETAALIVQHPNFFGGLEDVAKLSKIAHEHGALLIQAFDPISVGVLKRPADLGADVAVAEGQGLGTPLQYGGPYLGVIAVKEQFVRRLPGRICGETVDRNGKRCFVLTLQTREQHIRREKATSNICTNQGLFALRASIYLSLMGPQGLRDVASLCVRKTKYAQQRLFANPRFESRFNIPSFKEFVVRDRNGRVAEILEQARQQGILAGIPLGTWYPDLADCFLVAVTEKRTKDEIDRWADVLSAS